jgi:hypothetical protein
VASNHTKSPYAPVVPWAELLLELENDKYKDYVLPNGSLIVEMDKLSYRYVEAAHYWYENLAETFTLQLQDKWQR